jgi:hypothetical protein
LWLLDTTSGDKRVIANTSADERAGQISPNGQWVAYESDQSGRFEIVVRAFPPPAAMWPVSTGGGAQPRWSWDGREIYFISPDLTLMAARVGHAPGQVKDRPLVVGRPEPLFPVHIVGGTLTEFVKAQYAVSRDGRFLMNEPVGEPAAVPITLILNWNPERRAGN